MGLNLEKLAEALKISSFTFTKEERNKFNIMRENGIGFILPETNYLLGKY